MKYLLILVMVFLLLNPAVSQVKKSDKERVESYRKYFFSRCLILGLEKDKAFENDISATVLEQDAGEIAFTNHAVKLDSLAQQFLTNITPFQIEDYGGKKPIFMRCLEFYESRRLLKELKRILKTPKVDKL
jgi:hypothetical protein